MVIFDSLLLLFSAFLFGVIDASIGMGYGTLLTSILLVTYFDPLQVVSAVLISQIAGDFLAAFFHHKFGNVDFSTRSRHLKITVTLSLLGFVGSIISVLIATNSPNYILSLYIGAVFTIIGLFVLTSKCKNRGFSWTRLICFGVIAAFNKGISGGGYGPIVATGQILSGEKPSSAVGIISLAEGVTSLTAVMMYIQMGSCINWTLAILLSIGIGLSAPVSAFIVKRIKGSALKTIIGISTVLLGLSIILRNL